MTSVMVSRYAYRSWYRPWTVEKMSWYTAMVPELQPTAT